MPEETKIEVIAGPKGEAELFELYEPNQPLRYTIRFKGVQSRTFMTLGEAYLEAGVLAGVKT